MLDGLRLAVGTLTAIPVRPPQAVDRSTARWAMLLAPVAVLPLAVLVGLVMWGARQSDLPAPVAGFAIVGILALGSRAFHLDGLSDVADGLTASYDRERSLAVMKSGTSGPAGTVALIVVLGVQAAAVSHLVPLPRGPVVLGLCVCLSRTALVVTCAGGVPGARADGLGASFVGTVPRVVGAVVWVVVLAAMIVATDSWRHGAVTAVLAGLAVVLLVHRAVGRFGGVTGDVYGAAIEIMLAVLLAGAAAGTVTLYTGSYAG